MDELENLQDRRALLVVLLRAAEAPDAVMRAVQRASGGRDTVLQEIARELGVNEFWAEAIAELPVSRFSTASVLSLRQELAELEARIRTMQAS